MFSFAFLIGIYSFMIFGLGISGNLYQNNIFIVTALLLIAVFYVVSSSVKLGTLRGEFKKISRTRLSKAVLTLLFLQILVNLIGVFGSEISFDALWYHLTLPKVFLGNNAIYHIPGNLLYYSDFPKLGELLYVSALAFSNEIAAKFIHFSFGILGCVAIYKISKKYLSDTYSLLAVLIFYSNLVVGWQSISAYVDLTRTFFEVMAFWGFLEWIKTKKTAWLVESALMVGLATCVKLTGLLSLLIYVFLIVLIKYRSGFISVFRYVLLFVILSIFVPLPYFIFSYINTGNPVYPLFTSILSLNSGGFASPINFAQESFTLLTHSQDPISPIYIMFIPIIILFLKS